MSIWNQRDTRPQVGEGKEHLLLREQGAPILQAHATALGAVRDSLPKTSRIKGNGRSRKSPPDHPPFPASTTAAASSSVSPEDVLAFSSPVEQLRSQDPTFSPSPPAKYSPCIFLPLLGVHNLPTAATPIFFRAHLLLTWHGRESASPHLPAPRSVFCSVPDTRIHFAYFSQFSFSSADFAN